VMLSSVALRDRSGPRSVASKTAFWDKPNPKKKATPLTAAQKAAAKRRAKAAGRPYPNLVDNAAVRRKRGKR
jgi:hypothetical protein